MRRLLADFGSVLVLLLLCGYYSAVTWSEQFPSDPPAGRQLARKILSESDAPTVLIVVRPIDQDRRYADAVREELHSGGADVLETVFAATPADARRELIAAADQADQIDVIVTHEAGSRWGPLQERGLTKLATEFPALRSTTIHKPASYHWPTFLTRQNLLNVINQNAVIAILAIGMTLVIISSGIDLSVGSLLALAGVSTAVCIEGAAGGASASWPLQVACAAFGMAVAGGCGVFNGLMTTLGKIPAFVVTLAMMMIARGLALIVAVRYQKIISGGATEGTPEAIRIHAVGFDTLGNGSWLGIPNPIWLMLGLYAAAFLVMHRTVLGRYIYAVGGNAEAARLAGVPVRRVLITVYAVCGAMAGLGGVLDASRFEGGRPNAGEMYELQVIAAVVVGGTSLAGGEGRVLGTLVGALIIAVIQNGLNMSGVKTYEQMIVFGGLILVAALLDQLKRRLWHSH